LAGPPTVAPKARRREGGLTVLELTPRISGHNQNNGKGGVQRRRVAIAGTTALDFAPSLAIRTTDSCSTAKSQLRLPGFSFRLSVSARFHAG
jgi:hypothetical protein